MSNGFHSSGATHPGPRAENQDACLSRPDLGLWAVADGAGGHQGGARASAAIVAALDAIPPGLTAAELLAQVRLRLDGVHATLRREAADLGEAAMMASTVVVLIVRGAHFACLWAGDSRAWRCGGGIMQLLTHDHSLVQELLDAGAITATAAEHHPQANVITRAIGATGDAPAVDKVIGPARPGDVFLLCSDGVWKPLGEDALARLLTVPASADEILTAALAANATDNATAIVVAMETPMRPRPEATPQRADPL